jgi:hypothetical protein
MQQPTFEQVATAYLQWAEAHETETFRSQQERIIREELQPILGKLSMLQVNRKVFDLVESLPDSQDEWRLLAVISSAIIVTDWAVPRLEDRSVRITLDSMQRTAKDFLHSQSLRLQMDQLRGRIHLWSPQWRGFKNSVPTDPDH